MAQRKLRLLGLVASLLLAACGSTTASPGGGFQAGDYVIGATTDLSGGTAALGSGLRDGYQAYVNWVNDHGGINGHKLTITILDDHADPTTGVANVKQLMQDQKISAALVFLSNVIVAVSPVLQSKKTPAVVQAVTPQLLHPMNPVIFAGDVVIGDESAPQADFIAKKLSSSAPKVGLIAAQSAALNIFYANAQSEIQKRGWTLAGNQQVPLTATTAAAQAGTIASAKPDAVMMALTDALAISATQTLRQQGFSGPIVNYNGGSALTTLQKLNDPEFYVVRSFPYPSDSATGALGDYVSAVKKAGGTPTQAFVINGYVQAWVLGQALQSCGYPCPPEKAAASLEKLSKLDTKGIAFGDWAYTRSDHSGPSHVRIFHLAAGGAAPSSVSDILPIVSS